MNAATQTKDPRSILTTQGKQPLLAAVHDTVLIGDTETPQDTAPEPPFNPVESFFYDGTKYFLDAGHQFILRDTG
jgi:hypothetical protein